MINLKVKELSGFIGRVIVVHVVTYFIFGIIFGLLLPKGHIMYAIKEMNVYFRPMSDPLVMSSTLFQLIRGAIIALGLFSFRKQLFERKYGWFSLWGLFVTLSILAPAGAAPGSIEGFIYTKLPLWYHIGYLPDIMLQTLAFSVLLFAWERIRSKKIGIPLLITFGIIITILLFSLIFGILTGGV
jgi:hypothetical protein